MKRETILLRIDAATKLRLRTLAKAERRNMTSFILSSIDKRIAEVDNLIKKNEETR